MPTVYPNDYALVVGDAVRDLFAGSVARLWKDGGLNPTRQTTIAECNAAECDFSGYPPAGITVALYTNPTLSTEGGVQFLSGLIQFISGAATPFVGNVVGGFYIESATGALQMVGTFDSAIPIGGPDQAVPFNVKQVFCR